MNNLAQDIWSSGARFDAARCGVLESSAITVDTDIRREFEDSWRDAFRRIEHISFLEPDWDGDNAEVPDEILLASVDEWLDSLYQDKFRPPSRIVAETDGAILLEWHWGDGGYLEAEISTPYVAALMFRESDTAAVQHDVIVLDFLKRPASPIWSAG